MKYYVESTDKLIEETETTIIEKVIVSSVKGHEITINGNVRIVIENGEEVFDHVVENENNLKLFAIYNQSHELVTSEEVIELRQTLGLSKRGFSEFSGIPVRTLNQIEAGSILSDELSDKLKLIKNADLVWLRERFLKSDLNEYSKLEIEQFNRFID
ncbi:hypothetical protein OIT44_06895 [Weissella ceti]|uniref:HTH cro/C1-type domain-containing protein n=1 Tax=Weissella ceti TaxID=759620 RepID=A0ABT3E5U2_9LACO|nr:hypothetical protein [Weissella ceti]MCW0953775.1 hypothetical protein [Weissella ceti]QVK11861.1 hypothetical protein KHQ31_06520 [Weissella ceti]